jgi:CubicO group peptidase (beta-lactamase class C family)
VLWSAQLKRDPLGGSLVTPTSAVQVAKIQSRMLARRIEVWLLLAVMSTAVRPACVVNQHGDRTTDAELVANVDTLAGRLARQEAFSGVVLLARHGQPLLRRAFGLADRTTGRLNKVDTPFDLASVGKMFTAVVVARLAQESLLSFEDTIGTLLPDLPAGPARSRVTVRHLLTMSSGIPDVFGMPAFWTTLPRIKTLSDFWPLFASKPLEFAPGTRWRYSNSNFLVLGSIVERVARVPFAEAVERYVVRPAGMTHTSYNSCAFPERARPHPHGPANDSAHAGERRSGVARDTAMTCGSAAGAPMGGGVSTADDLERFAEALMNGQLLSRGMTQRVMTGEVPTGYGGRDGYGFETRVLNGIRIMGHIGGFTGISNQVDFYPDLGYVLVVLSNSDGNGTQEIASRVRVLIAGPVP